MNLKQLELLKYTLELAQTSNGGTGVWLADEYDEYLEASLKLVNSKIAEEKRNGNAGAN